MTDPVIRYDYGEVRGTERTPEGFLRVPAAITRIGVLRYKDVNGREWGELKLPEEVFSQESMATLRGRPVCDLHPPGMVNAQNWREYSVGSVGDDARPEMDFLVATLTVLDAKEIQMIDAGERVEVSAGYFCDIEPTPGEWNGEKYDGIQRNIRHNHCAIGPRGWGRAGPQVALRMDGAAMQVTENASAQTIAPTEQVSAPPNEQPPAVPAAAPDPALSAPIQPTSSDGAVSRQDDTEEIPMSLKLKVRGKEYRCDAEEDVTAAQGAVDEIAKNDEDMSAELASAKEALSAALSKIIYLEAKLEAQKQAAAPLPEDMPEETLDSVLAKKPAYLAKKVAAMAALHADARKVVGAEFKLDGLSEREIHEAVVRERLGADVNLKALSNEYLKGRFDEAVKTPSAARNDALAATNEVAARPTPKPSDLKVDGWVADPVSAMNDRTQNAWKQPLLHSKRSDS